MNNKAFRSNILSLLVLISMLSSTILGTAGFSLARASAPAAVQPALSDFIYAPINPVSVDLSQVAAQASQAGAGEESYAARFRRDAAEIEALRATARTLPVSENIQLATSIPGPSAPLPGTSFDSLDTTECCGGTAVVPPDPDMAAGPDHLIAVVNKALEIYDKSGNSLLGPTTFASFFAADPTCTNQFDPTVVYDEEADRFIIGADGNGTHFCMAVTQTGDPTGTYYLYTVPATPVGGEFHDYPHMGVGNEAIFMGANQFGGSIPGGFEGRVWAFDKAAMYAGATMTPVTFSTGFEGTPQPLNLHGFLQGTWPTTNTHYILTDPYDGATMTVWEWPNALSGGIPTIVNTLDLNAATGVTGGFPVSVPQSGGDNLEGNDWRFRNFEYRNGSAWATDTVSCDPGGGIVNCVRWTQIDLTVSPPVILQASVYASSGDFRTFPDLAVNACNDMAIGYTKSNSGMFPGIWYTGRLSTDFLNTLQPEAELKAGEVTYVAYDGAPLRWGDYTGMTIDPDGVTFWYLGEYSKNIVFAANWGTYIGSFTYQACAAPNLIVQPTYLIDTLQPDRTATYTFTISNTGGVTLTWNITEEVDLLTTPQLPSGEKTQPGSSQAKEYPVVTSPADCAQYENYSGVEPLGYAEICLGITESKYSIQQPFAPGELGYAQDIGFVSDNFVNFALGDFSGQTVISTSTQVYYGMDFDINGNLMALNDTTDELGYISLWDGTFQPILSIPPPGGGIWTGLTIDPVSNIYYASNATDLYTIDPITGTTTLIGPFGTTLMIDIAINAQGEMYGHDIGTDSIYSIDIPTGAATLIGPTGYLANFAQGMDFDNNDGTLYIFLYQGGGANVYGTVDLNSGAVTPLATSNPPGEFEGATLTELGCTPSDLPWVIVDPLSGETAPFGSSEFNVTIDTTGLAQGVYTGLLCLTSNDPDNPITRLPLQITVDPKPILEYAPGQIEVTLPLHNLITSSLVITNTGTETLTFGMEDFETGYSALPLAATPDTTCAPDAYGYTCTDSSEPEGLVMYDFEDISSSGITLTLTDDSVSSQVPLGFEFVFYGNPFTITRVSSNGFLTFLTGQYSGCCSGRPIPAPDNNNGLIAGWWEDLDPGEVGAEIYYATLGTAPHRRFITQFTNVQHWPSGNPVTFQIKLFEGSDNIEVHYMDPATDGGTHSAGIENREGSLGLQYFLGTTPLAPSLAVCYMAPGQTTCGSGSSSLDAPWVSELPTTVALGINASQTVDIIFDASQVTQTGTYTASLYFIGNYENTVLPANLVMHVISNTYGVELSPDAALEGLPATMMEYTVQITNTGDTTDTFDLTFSGNTWNVHLPITQITLAAGESADFAVHVTIDAGAADGDNDHVTITATSQGDVTKTDSTELATTAFLYSTFLSLVYKN